MYMTETMTGARQILIIPLYRPDPDAPVPPPQNLRANFTGGSTNLSSHTPQHDHWLRLQGLLRYRCLWPALQRHRRRPRGNSPIDVGKVTHFTLSGLGGGVHIAATGYDTQGRESWYSNEADSSRRIYLPIVLK